MSNYEKVPYDVIHNIYGCVYYKLVIDGKSHFDEFVKALRNLPNETKSLRKVLTLMEKYSPNIKLPKEKFRHIEGLKRKDVFEFKDVPCVRVYVVLQAPNIFIVDGSVKKEQDKAISRLGRLLKDFNIEEV